MNENSRPEALRDGAPQGLLSSLDLMKVLKALGNFLGIVGGGGAGFAALAYGIGYLAVKNHHVMLGLPVVGTTQASYMTVGALFFYNSVYYLLDAVLHFLHRYGTALLLTGAVVGLPPALARLELASSSRMTPARWVAYHSLSWLLIAAVVGFFGELARLDLITRKTVAPLALLLLVWLLLADRWKSGTPSGVQRWGVLIAYLVFIVLGIVNLRVELSVLHFGNQELLHKKPDVEMPGYSRDVNKLLRTPDYGEGVAQLRRLYGERLGLALSFILVALLIRKWRRSLAVDREDPGGGKADSVSGGAVQTIFDWGLRPMLYSVILLQVLAMPSIYGVMCLPRSFPCVEVMKTKEAGQDGGLTPSAHLGFLLTDLSVDATKFVVLEPKEGDLILHLEDLEGDLQMKLRRCPDPNIVQEEPQ